MRKMRTKLVVLIVLVLVLASMISVPAQAGWWAGDSPSLGTDAFPVNQLRLTPRFRDGFDPLTFTIASKVDKDGNPLSLVTAFFEENLTIMKGERPLMATCQAKIMMGEGGLGEMYATYNGGMIKIFVEPDNGWEEGTEWLKTAIEDAQVQAGMRTDLHKADPRFRQKYRNTERAEQRERGEDPRCDPGIFPPFVTAPADSRPRVLPDGTIHFDNPQKSVNVKIVVPISNALDGDGCYVSLFVKHQKGKGKLWEQTSANFITSHMARITIPNPEITRARTQAAEPPLARERIRSVSPPPAAPLVQAGELPNITTYNTAPPPIAQAPNYSAVPWQIEKWLYGFYGCTRNQDWTRPCVFPMPTWETQTTGSLLIYAIRQDGSLFDDGIVTILINGQLHNPAAPYYYLIPIEARAGRTKDAVTYVYVQGGATFHVEVRRYSNRKTTEGGELLGTFDGVTGPAGTVTTAPVRLGY